ncbi:MAG: hypothetical protein ABJK37_10790 [Paraglaciecola sp.]|uniref:hypothetical protein n=1 Tax=Paraglaciecola sp. TaxID=1920173 RepID=UPI003296CCC1
MPNKRIFAGAFFPQFAIPLLFAFVLVALSTNWTFDLFAPQFLWKAYNYYFLSLLDGGFDVPVESIGREGGFYEGKAYMYYGLLPALARVFLYPFVDLTQTPTSLFCIMLFTLSGLFMLQRSLNEAFYKRDKGLFSQSGLIWLILTTISWLGSATFMISQGGTIYHEPYAASLCLFNFYLALLIKDGFFQSADHSSNFLPYAILAALAIHTRMPMALALFLCTGIIFLVQAYRFQVSNRKSTNIAVVAIASIRLYWVSILTLFIGGLSILVLNYIKYADPMAFMGGNYGYSFLEGITDRKCKIIPTTEYKRFFRIIANSYIYLTGDWQGHWSLTWHLKTGYGRWELPLIPLGILWLVPLLCVVTSVGILMKGIKQLRNQVLLLGFFALSAGALFQLSYPTITHRYIAELWAPFILATVWLAYAVRGKRLKNILLTGIGVFALVGVCYQLYLANFDKYYLENGPIYKHFNYHYSDADNDFLASLTPELIITLKDKEKSEKEGGCKAIAERMGVAELLEQNK